VTKGTDAGHPVVFDRLESRERRWLARVLRDETVGGGILLLAAVTALLWANSPWGDAYTAMVNLRVGPAALHLNLTLGTWAADAVLALFFFVAGLELKHEFLVGTLRRFSQAVVPIAAALGGMIVPALLYLALAGDRPGAGMGWGIPMATDIAFALGVLAVAGRNLPAALRAFLLALAVIDDLGAITVIAVAYTDSLNALALLAAAGLLLCYWLLQRQRVRSAWLYVPLAAAVWYLVHESGVHATVAGVALALLTRLRTDPGEVSSPADRLQHRLHPWSAFIAIPVFALFAAGVDLRGTSLIGAATEPVALAIAIALVVGKPVGVLLGAWLTTSLTRARLNEMLTWLDVVAVGVLAGIGFTVSLLINELAFEASTPAGASGLTLLAEGKVGILTGSIIAAGCAVILLRLRARAYRRIAAADSGRDWLPDVVDDPADGTLPA